MRWTVIAIRPIKNKDFKMKRVLATAIFSVGFFVTGCGGGGSSTGGATPQAAAFSNPSLYTGIWYSDCASHTQDTLTITNDNGALLLNAKTEAFASANCSGAVLATVTYGADVTVGYLATVDSLVQLTATGIAQNIKVDKVHTSVGQNQQIVTGATVTDQTQAGVAQRCVAYSDGGSACWNTGVSPATSTDAGFYISTTDLFVLNLSATGVYSVGGQLYKVRPTIVAPTTLQITDTVVGTGATALAGKTVTVNYTGWLYSSSAANFRGTQFDTSVGKVSFSFKLGAGQVIPGFDQGVAGMKVGGTRTLVIPASLAYGSTGSGVIPGNAALVFSVDLLSVN